MRCYLTAAIVCVILYSCNSNTSDTIPAPQNPVTTDTARAPHFFPVTSYLKGQLYEIREKGLAPIRYVKVNEHTDSSFLKLDELEQAVHEFLTPVIDTANLTSVFNGSEFLDQTIDAITFTYDPKGKLPDSLQLRHWDIYINPETQKVKRVYMVKNVNDTVLQLTWQSGAWCQVVTLDKTSKVIKEEKITWSY